MLKVYMCSRGYWRAVAKRYLLRANIKLHFAQEGTEKLGAGNVLKEASHILALLGSFREMLAAAVGRSGLSRF